MPSVGTPVGNWAGSWLGRASLDQNVPGGFGRQTEPADHGLQSLGQGGQRLG
jgi:hypothetical protein